MNKSGDLQSIRFNFNQKDFIIEKIQSIEDLEKVSNYPTMGILHNVDLQFTAFASVSKQQNYVNNLIFAALNVQQKKAFLTMHKLISESFDDDNDNIIDNNRAATTFDNNKVVNPKVLSLDSCPGTGKTFLMSSFSTSYYNSGLITYIVYRTQLARNANKIGEIHGMTNSKFIINYFDFKFKQSMAQYTTTCTELDGLFRLLMILKNIRRLPEFNLLILDEYTIVAPELLVFLYLYCNHFNINLLMSGDAQQQNSIEKSRYHNMSNFYLLKILRDDSIILQQIMRCTDEQYNGKLEGYRNLIKYTGYGNTKFYYHVEYYIFKCFKKHYFIANDYTATYLASTHLQLTNRIKRYVEFLKKTNTKYYIAPFYAKVTVGEQIRYIKMNEERTGKFYPMYILVPNTRYICTAADFAGFVTLNEVILNSNNYPISIIITKDDGKKIQLELTSILPTQILEPYMNWLMEDPIYGKYSATSLVQFPIIPLYISTFHSAQGLTLSNNIEIDTNKATCESIYVGLSRITEGLMLKKIYSPKILSMYTTYLIEKYKKEKEYYFSIPLNSNSLAILNGDYEEAEKAEMMKNLEYRNFESIETFERYVGFGKIKQSCYSNVIRDTTETKLMKLCRFIKLHKTEKLMDLVKHVDKEARLIKCSDLLSATKYEENRKCFTGFNELKKLYDQMEDNEIEIVYDCKRKILDDGDDDHNNGDNDNDKNINKKNKLFN